MGSCNTGIESTKTIHLSKSDMQILKRSPEQLLIDSLEIPTLDKWEIGREFIVADSRASLIYNPNGRKTDPADFDMKGRTMLFDGVSYQLNPAGDKEAILNFTVDGTPCTYATGKNEAEVKTISAVDLPMIIDVNTISNADRLLAGRTLYTRSPLWYDQDGNPFNGRRFEQVTVAGVVPGNNVFPLEIVFSDQYAQKAGIFINMKTTGVESRPFEAMFFLTDPRKRYESISDEHWESIRRGNVKIGMTKEECRLAWGNPSDVDEGHDWDRVVNLWHYPDGSYLRFQDGLLVSYRK